VLRGEHPDTLTSMNNLMQHDLDLTKRWIFTPEKRSKQEYVARYRSQS
jgi:hypothetical protein